MSTSTTHEELSPRPRKGWKTTAAIAAGSAILGVGGGYVAANHGVKIDARVPGVGSVDIATGEKSEIEKNEEALAEFLATTQKDVAKSARVILGDKRFGDKTMEEIAKGWPEEFRRGVSNHGEDTRIDDILYQPDSERILAHEFPAAEVYYNEKTGVITASVKHARVKYQPADEGENLSFDGVEMRVVSQTPLTGDFSYSDLMDAFADGEVISLDGTYDWNFDMSDNITGQSFKVGIDKQGYVRAKYDSFAEAISGESFWTDNGSKLTYDGIGPSDPQFGYQLVAIAAATQATLNQIEFATNWYD